MGSMFNVRSSPCPVPPNCIRALPYTLLHRGRPPPPACRPSHLSPHGKPSFRLSAGRKLPVQHQQATHSLRVGGHLRLRLRWIWLEL
eukprot:scaffold60773_cov44-Phaeocystis_antarctica.AAC.1